MHFFLVSQEFVLIIHAIVLSPKQMADQQLGPSTEESFRVEKLSADKTTCLYLLAKNLA